MYVVYYGIILFCKNNDNWNHPWTFCGLTVIAFGNGLSLSCTSTLDCLSFGHWLRIQRIQIKCDLLSVVIVIAVTEILLNFDDLYVIVIAVGNFESLDALQVILISKLFLLDSPSPIHHHHYHRHHQSWKFSEKHLMRMLTHKMGVRVR